MRGSITYAASMQHINDLQREAAARRLAAQAPRSSKAREALMALLQRRPSSTARVRPSGIQRTATAAVWGAPHH